MNAEITSVTDHRTHATMCVTYGKHNQVDLHIPFETYFKLLNLGVPQYPAKSKESLQR